MPWYTEVGYAKAVYITAEEIAIVDTKLDTMDFDVFGGHAAR